MMKTFGGLAVLAVSACFVAGVGCDDDEGSGNGDGAAAGSGGVSNTAGVDGSAVAGSGGAGGNADSGAGDGGVTDSSVKTDGASLGMVSQPISAAAGGTVLANGASIEIPPGALSADTTITVSILAAAGQPDAANIISKVYDLGPNGLRFNKPVKLTIDFDASKPAVGKNASIAFLEAMAWSPLADSSAAAGKMTATTTHFTPFAVVLSTPVAGGNCKFKGNYTLETIACGAADITAPWKSAVTSTTFVITDKVGGGCAMKQTYVAAGCTEVENTEATAPVGDVYQWLEKGIASCSPNGCKLNANDAACVVGDRASTVAGSITIKSEGAKIRMTMPAKAAGGGLCGTSDTIILLAP